MTNSITTFLPCKKWYICNNSCRNDIKIRTKEKTSKASVTRTRFHLKTLAVSPPVHTGNFENSFTGFGDILTGSRDLYSV